MNMQLHFHASLFLHAKSTILWLDNNRFTKLGQICTMRWISHLTSRKLFTKSKCSSYGEEPLASLFFQYIYRYRVNRMQFSNKYMLWFFFEAVIFLNKSFIFLNEATPYFSSKYFKVECKRPSSLFSNDALWNGYCYNVTWKGS